MGRMPEAVHQKQKRRQKAVSFPFLSEERRCAA